MNKIVNKFLLTGDKFIPEIHLKQPGFTYRACGPFTKNKKRIQEYKNFLKLAFNMIWRTKILKI